MMPQQMSAAARMHQSRRVRDAVFGEERQGFGEPAWDMLLALFARDADDSPMTAGELLVSSAAPASIASTYLDWLVSRELVKRTRDAADAHAAIVTLSARARALMTTYLDHEGAI